MKYRIVVDYETRSEVNVRDVGGIAYAQHPSTEIMCMGYKINNDKARIWLPHQDPPPKDLVNAWNYDQDANLVAHNALFEYCISHWVLRRRFPTFFAPAFPRRFKCTAAKAAACALPRSLEGAGLALDLPVKKNMRGRRLMLKHSMPRSKWVKTGQGEKWFEDEFEREEIYAYCRTDVEAEHLLDLELPDLSPYERKVWLLNIDMNIRGVQVDVPLARKIWGWVGEESLKLNTELKEITKGEVNRATERDKLLKWINSEIFTPIPNLKAETVTKVLKDAKFFIPDDVRRALEIRQSVGKSSLKKYPAMVERVCSDGRVKDYSLYHGASTGREAGRGLQLQNLVKGKIKDTNLAIKLIGESEDLEEIRFLYGDPFEVFSSCVRGMIKATPQHDLYVADYNAIEARVLHWIADDKPALKRWHEGVDSYVHMASPIYGVPIEKVTYEQRDIGKRAELGCGFGMGGKKFYATCLQYGAENVTPELCNRAVNIYRKTHPAVTQLWNNLEEAAIQAVKYPGRIIRINKTAWQVLDHFLWATLPSGRKLAYHRPSIKKGMTSWGEERAMLHHWGENPKTRKWENAGTYGGRLTENIVQATARDITVNAMLNLKRAGYNFLFMVHDEIVSEAYRKDKKTLAEYEQILCTLPQWAKGLPIVAKGWVGERYKKA